MPYWDISLILQSWLEDAKRKTPLALLVTTVEFALGAVLIAGQISGSAIPPESESVSVNTLCREELEPELIWI
jgi:hypothetical protein|tara:strand:- start:20 stop:238 length:219 start_codon:yes stop_codon:yes gene_type:complete